MAKHHIIPFCPQFNFYEFHSAGKQDQNTAERQLHQQKRDTYIVQQFQTTVRNSPVTAASQSTEAVH